MPEENSRNIEEPLEPLILTVRGQRVILDADLARVYGVSTKALNQAVKQLEVTNCDFKTEYLCKSGR